MPYDTALDRSWLKLRARRAPDLIGPRHPLRAEQIEGGLVPLREAAGDWPLIDWHLPLRRINRRMPY